MNLILFFLWCNMSIHSPYSSSLFYYPMSGWRTASTIEQGVLQNSYYLNNVHSCTVYGDVLFCAGSGSNGIVAVDISNPATPEAIGWVEDQIRLDAVIQFVIEDDYLYAACDDGSCLTIVDVANPYDMQIVGSYYTGADMTESMVACAKYGNYVYVACRGIYITSRAAEDPTPLKGDAVLCLDVSDPTNPTLVSSVQDHTNLIGARDIVISPDGSTALVAVPWSSPNSTVALLDISTPASMSYDSSISVGTPWAHGLAIIDSQYVAVSAGSTLQIVDYVAGSVTDSLSSASLAGNYKCAIYGDYVVTANRTMDSVAIIDASNKADISIVDTLVSTTYLGDSYFIDVDGDNAYAVGMSTKSLAVIDLTDPTNLAIKSDLPASPSLKPLRATRDRITGKTQTQIRRQITGAPGAKSGVATKKYSQGSVDFEFAPYEYREMLAASVGASPIDVSVTTGADVSFSGSTMTSTATSFETAGVVAGQNIRIAGSGLASSNVGVFEVASVSGTTVTITDTFTSESSKTATVTGYCLRDGVTEWPFYIERSFTDSPKYLSFDNMVAKEFRLTVPESGACHGMLIFDGGTFDYDDASAGTASSWSAETPLLAADLTAFEIGGYTESLVSFDARMSNVYQPIRTAYQRGCTKMQWKSRTLTGSMRMYFDNITDAEFWASTTQTDIKLQLSGDYDFVLYYPEVMLSAATIAGVDRGLGIELELQFEALLNDNETYSIQMDVV